LQASLNYRHKFVHAPLECMHGTICETHWNCLFLILELFAKNAILKNCTVCLLALYVAALFTSTVPLGTCETYSLNYRHKFVHAPLECKHGTICETHWNRLFLILELFAKNAI
jgi:hypothetical protein